MKHHRFGVKEAVVALVTADNPASNSGVVNGPWYPYQGLQTFGYQISPQVERLITEGIKRAEESSIDDIPIDLEYGQFVPDIEALLTGSQCWYDGDGNQHFAITENFGNAYCSLKVRVDKVGANGYDVVYLVPKIKVSGLNRQGQQRAFAPNRFTVGASFTDSTWPGYKDGVKQFLSRAVLETLRPAGTALYSLSSTAPTVTSINSSASGTVTAGTGANFVALFAIDMNVNSVNDLTFELLSSGTPVPAVVTPTGTGVTALREFTLNPDSALATGDYQLRIKTIVRSKDGVLMAAEYTRNVTIS